MDIEETLRMYAPNWKPAGEVQPGDRISIWGNYREVTRIGELDGPFDIEIFYSVNSSSEKSVRCHSDDLVATKAPA